MSLLIVFYSAIFVAQRLVPFFCSFKHLPFYRTSSFLSYCILSSIPNSFFLTSSFLAYLFLSLEHLLFHHTSSFLSHLLLSSVLLLYLLTYFLHCHSNLFYSTISVTFYKPSSIYFTSSFLSYFFFTSWLAFLNVFQTCLLYNPSRLLLPFYRASSFFHLFHFFFSIKCFLFSCLSSYINHDAKSKP